MVYHLLNDNLGLENYGKVTVNDNLICGQVSQFMTTLCVGGWS